MKLVSIIAATSLLANVTSPAWPSETMNSFILSCQGNLIPFPFPIEPEEDRERPHHNACHAVCCKRKGEAKPEIPDIEN